MSNHNSEKLKQSIKDTGGPAFPCECAGDPASNEHQTGVNSFMQYGMTLRQYYAAHCPITWIEAQDYNTTGADEMMFFCMLRYQYADAMISAGVK